MRSGQETYPPDEFDTVAPSGPRGAHRAPRSRWSRWWPFLVVLVVFPALAFGIVTWLSDWDGLPGVGDAGVSEPEDPTADGGTGAEGEDPGDGVTEPLPEEPVAEEPPPPPPADLTLPVEVFNATSTAGLAGSAKGTLETAGHTAVKTGNWSGQSPSASVVYFPTPESEPTATAVAATLGIATVTASSDVTAITVVLSTDFTP